MGSEGLKRYHEPDCAFYEEGNVLWELERLARYERLHWAAHESRTPLHTTGARDANNEFTCMQCGRTLGTAHVLSLHTEEAHSPLFKAQLRRQKDSHRHAPNPVVTSTAPGVQGWQGAALPAAHTMPLSSSLHSCADEGMEGLFRCLEADCHGRFWSPKRRRLHWLAVHAAPGKEQPPFYLTPKPKNKKKGKGKKSNIGQRDGAADCDAMDISGSGGSDAMNLDCSSSSAGTQERTRRPARGGRRGHRLML